MEKVQVQVTSSCRVFSVVISCRPTTQRMRLPPLSPTVSQGHFCLSVPSFLPAMWCRVVPCWSACFFDDVRVRLSKSALWQRKKERKRVPGNTRRSPAEDLCFYFGKLKGKLRVLTWRESCSDTFIIKCSSVSQFLLFLFSPLFWCVLLFPCIMCSWRGSCRKRNSCCFFPCYTTTFYNCIFHATQHALPQQIRVKTIQTEQTLLSKGSLDLHLLLAEKLSMSEAGGRRSCLEMRWAWGVTTLVRQRTTTRHGERICGSLSPAQQGFLPWESPADSPLLFHLSSLFSFLTILTILHYLRLPGRRMSRREKWTMTKTTRLPSIPAPGGSSSCPLISLLSLFDYWCR